MITRYKEYYNFNIGAHQNERADVSIFTYGSRFKVWTRNSNRWS